MKILSFQERIDFVDEVIKRCTVENEYQPALFDPVFRLTVMKYFDAEHYGNYEKEPQDTLTDMAYEDYDASFIDCEIGEDVIYTQQIDSLREACLAKIERAHNEFLTLAIVSKRDSLSEFLDKLSEYLDGMKEQFNQINIDDVSSLLEALNGAKTKENVIDIAKNLQALKEGKSGGDS